MQKKICEKFLIPIGYIISVATVASRNNDLTAVYRIPLGGTCAEMYIFKKQFVFYDLSLEITMLFILFEQFP